LSTLTRNLSLFLLSLLTGPAFVKAASIEINGTCEVGDCSTAGLESSAIGVGQSVGPNSINLGDYTVGTDVYDIDITSFGASYVSGTYIYIDFSATYIGTSPSTSADTIQINELQDFYNNLPGTWDGTYTENVPAIVGTGTTLQTNLCYNGGGSTACVGQVGPVGAGAYNYALSNSLSGLGGGDYLAGDFDFLLTFPDATAPGTTVDLPSSVPEPTQTIPVAILLVGLVCAILIRDRRRSVNRGEVNGFEAIPTT
jgi:hypothetical protein